MSEEKKYTLEEWADLKDYKGMYKISTFGRIKSLDRYIHHEKGGKSLIFGRIKSLSVSNCGYNAVTLCKDGINKTFIFHRLIALSFIPNPDNKPQVNHKDGNKLNNNVSNLEWCTPKENIQHAIKIGLRKDSKGISDENSKLTEGKVLEIRELYSSGKYYLKDLSRKFNVSVSLISQIKRNEIWTHI